MFRNEKNGAGYDIAVVGAGASGAMAAITAGRLGRSVALIERNDAIGKKILITGKGRCNLTNTGDIDTFIEKFGRQGQFLRSAFHAFSNEDLIEFFRSAGLDLKVERQGRVFPATDSAKSVVETLTRCLSEAGVEVLCGLRLRDIKRSDDRFNLIFDGRIDPLEARRVVLATGGLSYKATGSTGDGLEIAEKFGHNLADMPPGLVPLRTKEAWVKGLQGLGLENIRIRFLRGKKHIVSEIGELMFTHFGVSGPLVLDLSAKVLRELESGEVKMLVDLKPGLSAEKLENRLLNEIRQKGRTHIKNLLKDFLPQRLIDLFIAISGISGNTLANQITQDQRCTLIRLFKELPLTIAGSLSPEEAMVTGKGISMKEIDPRSMRSRVTAGIYFAGEIMEGCAPSGGYNLQQAFSTGYLAGREAANSLG